MLDFLSASIVLMPVKLSNLLQSTFNLDFAGLEGSCLPCLISIKIVNLSVGIER